jgi:hypothetical protein
MKNYLRKHIALTELYPKADEPVSKFLQVDHALLHTHTQKVFEKFSLCKGTIRPEFDQASLLYRSLLSSRETVSYAVELDLPARTGLSCGPDLVYGSNYIGRYRHGVRAGLLLPGELLALDQVAGFEANCVEMGLSYLHILRSVHIPCAMVMAAVPDRYMHMYVIALLDGQLYEFHAGPKHYIKPSGDDHVLVHSSDAQLHDHLCCWDARIHYEQTRYDDALGLLSVPLQHDHRQPYAWQYLAKLLFVKGQYQNSFEAYVKGVSYDRSSLIHSEVFDKTYELYSMITERTAADDLDRITQAARYLYQYALKHTDEPLSAMAYDVLQRAAHISRLETINT